MYIYTDTILYTTQTCILLCICWFLFCSTIQQRVFNGLRFFMLFNENSIHAHIETTSILTYNLYRQCIEINFHNGTYVHMFYMHICRHIFIYLLKSGGITVLNKLFYKRLMFLIDWYTLNRHYTGLMISLCIIMFIQARIHLPFIFAFIKRQTNIVKVWK